MEPAGDEPTPPPQPTPLVLVFALAAVAVLGLTLSVLLYAGQIHRAGCEPIGVAGTPGCETPLLDLADAFTESDLPWKVDVIDRHTTSASFLQVIEPHLIPVLPIGQPAA